MKLIVGLIVGRALIVLRFKQCDGYDGDGGGGDVVRVGLVRVAKAYGGGGKAEGGWRHRWRRR